MGGRMSICVYEIQCTECHRCLGGITKTRNKKTILCHKCFQKSLIVQNKSCKECGKEVNHESKMTHPEYCSQDCWDKGLEASP